MLDRFRHKMRWLYDYLTAHRHILVGVFLLLGVGMFVYARTVLAADATSGTGLPNEPGFFIGIITRMLLALAQFFISITLFILSFVIEIAGYNGYLDGRAVNLGWVVVRDVTNMVFVVALLIIAFSTILGVEHYEWKKQLFKLVGAAVIVNFSRTICGAIIDVAQVVMNTFVNGIAATAGGNLIQAFSLQNIGKISASDPALFNDTNYFIAGFGSVFFAVCVAALMGAVLYILVARMMVLWILIVLSPIAFVLSAVPQTEEYSNQWWSEFGANVITGPVLLFFIWLSFATIGSGDLGNHVAQNTITKQVDTSEAAQYSNPCSAIVVTLCWNNMQTWILSFGILAVGVKVTTSLGGAGASAAEKMFQLGQEGAMVLTGASSAMSYAENKGEQAKLLGTAAVQALGIGWNKMLGGNKAGFLARRFQAGSSEKVTKKLQSLNESLGVIMDSNAGVGDVLKNAATRAEVVAEEYHHADEASNTKRKADIQVKLHHQQEHDFEHRMQEARHDFDKANPGKSKEDLDKMWSKEAEAARQKAMKGLVFVQAGYKKTQASIAKTTADASAQASESKIYTELSKEGKAEAAQEQQAKAQVAKMERDAVEARAGARIKTKLLEKEQDEFDKIYKKRIVGAKAAAGSNWTDQMDAKLRRQILAEGYDHGHKQFSAIQAYQAEADKRTSLSKIEKEEAYAVAGARDIAAIDANKPAIYLKREQMRKHREKMEDYSLLTYEERADMLGKYQAEVASLKDKEAKGTITDAEKGRLNGTMKNTMLLTTSMFENNDGQDLTYNLDASWGNTPIDGNNQHAALLSIMTGKKYNDLHTNGALDVAKVRAAEQELRGRLSDSADMYFRNLGAAMDKNGGAKGEFQYLRQIYSGVNEKGERVYGFTNNMTSGERGKDGLVATGKASYDGNGVRNIKVEQFRSRHNKLSSSDDGRGHLAVDHTGKAVRFLDPDAQEEVESSIASLTNGIAMRNQVNNALAYLLSGGNTGESGYSNGAFHMNEEIQSFMERLLSRMYQSMESKSGAGKVQMRESITQLVSKMTKNAVSSYDQIFDEQGNIVLKNEYPPANPGGRSNVVTLKRVPVTARAGQTVADDGEEPVEVDEYGNPISEGDSEAK